MSSSRTVDMTHKLPPSFVAAWRKEYLQSLKSTGSILRVSAPMTKEQQRVLRFGPVWAWWGVPDEQRAIWWGRDGDQGAA
jgi:hypothetical protein